ncbi:L-dopachrome tautomerase-related protein [Zunongwangia sp. HGR-M22]|uniref:L-dopachrome tautomerase-related protein n=1 Tax=Zunongwangia sp. HGR-M22 TaxID=3015168 RepID=UPI0022DDA2C9|nr:L-dopachrome tautomerase-related protein [Zunongwangia sp. HGR-M22]WBL24440.1 L-dopachrome tautomerase-related protein [Zunongwangia sp. HGR-M22]
MMKTSLYCIVLMLLFQPVAAQEYHSDNLETVADLGEYMAIGLSVSSDNRVFVSFPYREGKPYKYGLTEIIEGKTVPYPNKAWNTHAGNEKKRFVKVQDLYVDANDMLWILDSKPSSGGSIFGDDGKAEAGKFKLLKINLKTDEFEHVYYFEDLDKTVSGLNDIRIDTDKQLGYLSDPGQAAVVILDLKTGNTRTVLQNIEATKANPEVVLTYHGKEMRNKDGKPFSSNVNGIALTSDNKYFYFKPINKLNLYRIETKFLADASLSERELEAKVEDLGKVGITHGLIADQKGNVYLTNSVDYSVKYVSPKDGKVHTLVQDSRLLWPDSLGIGSDGFLYFSCSQLQRQSFWNDGESNVEFPYQIFRVKLP